MTTLDTLNPTIKYLELNSICFIRTNSLLTLFKDCECLFSLWGGEADWNANYFLAFKTIKGDYFTFTTYSCSNCCGSSEIDDYDGFENWSKNILPTKIRWYNNIEELKNAVKNFDIKPYYEEYANEINKLDIKFFIKGCDATL